MIRGEKMKCVVCGDIVPMTRGKKDTCTMVCGLRKMEAWDGYIQRHKADLMAKALEEYKRE